MRVSLKIVPNHYAHRICTNTYMTTAVQCIVGQLDFIEEHRLCHPVRTQCRAVRMQVDATVALRLGPTGGHPLRARVLEAALANWHHLDHDTVVGVLVQAAEGGTQRREHATAEGDKTQVLVLITCWLHRQSIEQL